MKIHFLKHRALVLMYVYVHIYMYIYETYHCALNYSKTWKTNRSCKCEKSTEDMLNLARKNQEMLPRFYSSYI